MQAVVQFQQNRPELFARAYNVTRDIDILAKISEHTALFEAVVATTWRLFDRRRDAMLDRCGDHKHLVTYTDLQLHSLETEESYQRVMAKIPNHYMLSHSVSGYELTVRCDNYDAISKPKIKPGWVPPSKFVTVNTNLVSTSSSLASAICRDLNKITRLADTYGEKTPKEKDRQAAAEACRTIFADMGRLNECISKIVSPVESTYICIIADVLADRIHISVCKDPHARRFEMSQWYERPMDIVFTANIDPEKQLHPYLSEKCSGIDGDERWFHMSKDEIIQTIKFASMCA